MSDETKKTKTGSESSVIVIILALLLVVVLAIVGVIVLKDSKGIATFDGGKVTKAEYKVYYIMFADYLKYYGYSSEDIPMEIAKKAAMDKMILVDAKAAGVKLSDEDKAEVDAIFSDTSYVEYFQSSGFDIDELKNIYYNDYIIAAYIEKLASEVSTEELTAYINTKEENPNMNEYDTSHILFSFTDDSGNALSDEDKAALKVKAEAILTRAKAGEDFATLASENSSDTATATNGGKYVMYMDGNTVDEYADTVAKMNAGEINATLVETSYGYHIIKLNAVTENGRINNTIEREAYANGLFDDISEKKNLVVNEDLLKAFVLEINPTAYDTDENTDDTVTQ